MKCLLNGNFMYCSYTPKAVKGKIFMLNRINRRINVWEEVGQGFHLERENCWGAPATTICPPTHWSRESAQTEAAVNLYKPDLYLYFSPSHNWISRRFAFPEQRIDVLFRYVTSQGFLSPSDKLSGWMTLICRDKQKDNIDKSGQWAFSLRGFVGWHRLDRSRAK